MRIHFSHWKKAKQLNFLCYDEIPYDFSYISHFHSKSLRKKLQSIIHRVTPFTKWKINYTPTKTAAVSTIATEKNKKKCIFNTSFLCFLGKNRWHSGFSFIQANGNV